MGGHDHGDHSEFHKVPDWRIYKVENAPPLKAVQDALASQGLRDPWLRNEVWKYEGDLKYEDYRGRRFAKVLFRGFKYGLAAAIVTSAVEKYLVAKYGTHDDDHHTEEH